MWKLAFCGMVMGICGLFGAMDLIARWLECNRVQKEPCPTGTGSGRSSRP